MGTCRSARGVACGSKLRKQIIPGRTRAFQGLYLQTLSCKDFLRDKAGEASRNCDGDGRERKGGVGKRLQAPLFPIVFRFDWPDKVPGLPRVGGREEGGTKKDGVGVKAGDGHLGLLP